MRIFLIALRVAFALYAGVALSALFARPAGAVSWSNPHHAYGIFMRIDGKHQHHHTYIKITSLDKRAPQQVLDGPKTRLLNSAAEGLAFGPQGNLYVSGSFVSTQQHYFAGVLIYPQGAVGDVPPIAMISGNKTRLTFPYGIAFDRAGNLYVANYLPGNSAIYVFAAGATGNVAPIARIGGSKTQFNSSLFAVAVDDSGEIFADLVTSTGAQVSKFPAGASGNVSPIAVATVGKEHVLTQIATSGNIVYVPVGAFHADPRAAVYELSTTNLEPIRALRNPNFLYLAADADSAGRVYAQNIVDGLAVTFFEFGPHSQTPIRTQPEGRSWADVNYIVVGP